MYSGNEAENADIRTKPNQNQSQSRRKRSRTVPSPTVRTSPMANHLRNLARAPSEEEHPQSIPRLEVESVNRSSRLLQKRSRRIKCACTLSAKRTGSSGGKTGARPTRGTRTRSSSDMRVIGAKSSFPDRSRRDE